MCENDFKNWMDTYLELETKKKSTPQTEKLL